MNAPKRRSRLVAAAAGLASLALVAGACGDDDTAAGGDTDEITLVSAAEGADARAERDVVIGRTEQSQGDSAAVSELSIVADETIMPVEPDCGIGGDPYVPSAEELAEANADAEALADTLETYGISYELVTDDLGYTNVETDYTDVVAQSVVDSFWMDRYPPEPVDPAELERIRSENDLVAAALDEAGVRYTRETDEQGWEWLEWDYENPEAQAAVDAVFVELYPPEPPSPQEQALIREENSLLAAALDEAGIAYTRMADDIGWEWIEWDYEDPEARTVVEALFAELYPVDDLPIGCPEIDPGLIDPIAEDDAESVDGDDAGRDAASTDAGDAASGDIGEDIGADTDELSPVDEGIAEPGFMEEEEIAILEPDVAMGEFTPRQVRQRDAEVAAMADGFAIAGVEFEVWGESPWASVSFDLANPAAVGVIADILAARG